MKPQGAEGRGGKRGRAEGGVAASARSVEKDEGIQRNTAQAAVLFETSKRILLNVLQSLSPVSCVSLIPCQVSGAPRALPLCVACPLLSTYCVFVALRFVF